MGLASGVLRDAALVAVAVVGVLVAVWVPFGLLRWLGTGPLVDYAAQLEMAATAWGVLVGLASVVAYAQRRRLGEVLGGARGRLLP